jgi:hypothetical protein
MARTHFFIMISLADVEVGKDGSATDGIDLNNDHIFQADYFLT